jgi:hypothetical protein
MSSEELSRRSIDPEFVDSGMKKMTGSYQFQLVHTRMLNVMVEMSI